MRPGDDGGLLIGQAVTDPDDGFRVVVIDPDLHTVEIEDAGGTVLIDTIEHFTASHRSACRDHEENWTTALLRPMASPYALPSGST